MRPQSQKVPAYDIVKDAHDNVRMPVCIGRIGDTLRVIPHNTALPALPRSDTAVWSYFTDYPAHFRVVRLDRRSVVTVHDLLESCDSLRKASEMFANRLELVYKPVGGGQSRGIRLVHAEFVSRAHTRKELASTARTKAQKYWQQKMEADFSNQVTFPTGVYLHKKSLGPGGNEEYELQLVLVDHRQGGDGTVRGVWNLKESYITLDGELASYNIVDGAEFTGNGYGTAAVALPVLTKYLERVIAPGTSLAGVHTVPVSVVSSYSHAQQGEWSIFASGDDAVAPRTTPGYWLDKNAGFTEMTELD